ncbi:MAG: hypothetical protein GF400_09500 [Candidatus Eisenbacteria bacterium]|nr:hypothetical protein [Candidatus Eisenbacteria bacterium]
MGEPRTSDGRPSRTGGAGESSRAASPSPEARSTRLRPALTEILAVVVGLALVLRYAWLMDDAYVYFRYVDNLVIGGEGLVWNPGEYVEGFSSPLWALLLALVRSLRLDYWSFVRAAGLVSFGAFSWLAILANRALTPQAARGRTGYNVPLVYLAVCYGALCYFTSGLESPLVLVMAGVYACALVRPRSSVFQVFLGISPLVRPELAVPFLLSLVFIRIRTRRVPLAAIIAALVSVGGYVAFRIWYYADLFPNTYHLKDALWASQGLTYLWDAVAPYGTIPLLVGMAALYLWLRRRVGPEALRHGERVAMAVMALAVAAYVVKVGGAPIHFKDLAFPFALAVLSGGGLLEAAAARWGPGPRSWTVVGTLALGVAVAFAHPRQLPRPPIVRPVALRHNVTQLISDAAFHRSPSAGLIPGRGTQADMLSYDAAERRHARAPRSDRPIVESWCKTAYVHPSTPVVHSLGLTEPFLARTPVDADRPAHKFGLEQLAEDVARVRALYGFRAGAFESALRDGRGEEWMRRNIESLRSIEARAYNDHRFLENLRLALRPPETIAVKESEIGRMEKRAD